MALSTARRGFLLALAGSLVHGCGTEGPTPGPEHIVIVTVDTLRADRLGAYGGTAVATPNFDRIASEGAVADKAVVHVPLTRPSHTSLFTGRLPSEHGIRDNVSAPLADDAPVLAELLRANGFETAAFVSSVVLSRQSGLDRGFDHYSDRFEGDADDARFLNTVQKTGDVTLNEAVSWLDAHRDAAHLFAWIHLYDPHDPYEPPEPYASDYAGHPYDGEVAWTDALIGELDDALERLGLASDTLLVITSDHGESLGEHAEPSHGYFIYDTTLEVPLLLRGPGIGPGARLSATVQSVDLVPTVLDLFEIAVPTGMAPSGRSLAPSLTSGAPLEDVPIYAESLAPLLHFGWSDLRSLREGEWKYIEAPRPELYHLIDDPEELDNLVSSRAATASRLREKLGAILDNERSAGSDQQASSIPSELLEQLGALGYLGAGSMGGEPSGEDPKDKVDDFRVANALMREALIRFNDGDIAGSIERFEELLDRAIESFEIHYYLARALLRAERFAAAIPHFEAALSRHRSYAAAYEGLAQATLESGDVPGAVEALREGRDALPEDAGLTLRHARLLRHLGRSAEAREAFEASLPLAPDDALARVQLGELLRDMGQPSEAAARLREAVALEPQSASYWNALGMVLGGESEWGDAKQAFETAVELDGDNAMYTYNLALVLLRNGQSSEAREWFQLTLDLDPRFDAAKEQLDRLAP